MVALSYYKSKLTQNWDQSLTLRVPSLILQQLDALPLLLWVIQLHQNCLHFLSVDALLLVLKEFRVVALNNTNESTAAALRPHKVICHYSVNLLVIIKYRFSR